DHRRPRRLVDPRLGQRRVLFIELAVLGGRRGGGGRPLCALVARPRGRRHPADRVLSPVAHAPRRPPPRLVAGRRRSRRVRRLVHFARVVGEAGDRRRLRLDDLVLVLARRPRVLHGGGRNATRAVVEPTVERHLALLHAVFGVVLELVVSLRLVDQPL